MFNLKVIENLIFDIFNSSINGMTADSKMDDGNGPIVYGTNSKFPVGVLEDLQAIDPNVKHAHFHPGGKEDFYGKYHLVIERENADGEIERIQEWKSIADFNPVTSFINLLEDRIDDERRNQDQAEETSSMWESETVGRYGSVGDFIAEDRFVETIDDVSDKDTDGSGVYSDISEDNSDENDD